MRGTGCARAGPSVQRGTGEEGDVKSSRIIITLLAWASSVVPGPPAVLPVSPQKDLSGDDHPERGGVKGWVIIALLSAVVLAVLLALAGPPLAALFTLVVERAGW